MISMRARLTIGQGAVFVGGIVAEGDRRQEGTASGVRRSGERSHATSRPWTRKPSMRLGFRLESCNRSADRLVRESGQRGLRHGGGLTPTFHCLAGPSAERKVRSCGPGGPRPF